MLKIYKMHLCAHIVREIDRKRKVDLTLKYLVM